MSPFLVSTITEGLYKSNHPVSERSVQKERWLFYPPAGSAAGSASIHPLLIDVTPFLLSISRLRGYITITETIQHNGYRSRFVFPVSHLSRYFFFARHKRHIILGVMILISFATTFSLFHASPFSHPLSAINPSLFFSSNHHHRMREVKG